MHEILACGIYIFLGLLAVTIGQTGVPREDRRYLWICFWAHIVGAFVLLMLTYHFFGHGDVQVYYRDGNALADFIRDDPFRWGPEVLRLMLQRPAELPVDIFGHQGSSTSSMIALTAFVMIATGSSEFAAGILFSLFAFSGQWGIYCAFRHHFPRAYRKRVLIATLLIPSAVLWTSGVVKEAIALGGMGWLIWGLHRWLVDRRRVRGIAWILIGGFVVSLSKGYILFPLTAGAAVWFFWQHSLAKTGTVKIAKKPFHMAGIAIVSIVGILLLGEVFPNYSIASIAEETAELQSRGERIQGGSSYSIGNPNATSLGGQLLFAPMALTATLFRPFLFEAHNPVALINTLETTAILFMWLKILWVRGIRGTWRVVRSSPALMFCVIFIVLFSLGVGLATTNLGTLSRYRAPMMPLYLLVLLMLYPTSPSPTRRSAEGEGEGPIITPQSPTVLDLPHGRHRSNKRTPDPYLRR